MKRLLLFSTLAIVLAACTSYKNLNPSTTMPRNSWDTYYKAYEGNLHDYNSDHRLCISLKIEDVVTKASIVQRLEELGYKESKAEIIDKAAVGEYIYAYAGEEEEGQEPIETIDLYHELPKDWGEEYWDKEKEWVEEMFGIDKEWIHSVSELWGPFERP